MTFLYTMYSEVVHRVTKDWDHEEMPFENLLSSVPVCTEVPGGDEEQTLIALQNQIVFVKSYVFDVVKFLKIFGPLRV